MKAFVRSMFKVKMDQVEIRLIHRALVYRLANDKISDNASMGDMAKLAESFAKALRAVGEDPS